MKQVLHAYMKTTSTTYYTGIQGICCYNTTYPAYQYPDIIPADGTLRKLRIKVGAAPGTGKSYTFTIYKSTPGSASLVATALTVTISDEETEGVDESNEVSISAGSLVSMKVSTSGSPSNTTAAFCTEWEGSYGLILANKFTCGYPYAIGPMGAGYGSSTSQGAGYAIKFPEGQISRLYGRLYGRTLQTFNQTLTLRVNDTPTDLEIVGVLPNDYQYHNVFEEDTTDVIDIADGDEVHIQAVPSYNPPTGYWCYGLAFAPADGETIPVVEACDAGSPSTSATNYHEITNAGPSEWGTTESAAGMISHAMVFRGLTVVLTQSPGGAGSKSYTFTLRKNGADTGITVTISGTDTEGSTEEEVTVEDGDILTMKCVPAGSPYSTDVTWIMGGYVPLDDRIYVWLGTESDPLQVELTDPDYPTAMAVRIERGRDEELGHAASGICEVTCDNQFGDFSPEKTDGQYYGTLALGVYLTVFEVYEGTKYYLFSGKVDKITPHPELGNLVAFIVAIDGMDDLAGSEIETVLRTDTDEQELIGDILDDAGWSATKRSLDTGVDTLQLGWFHAIKALAAIQGLEDTTRGFFLVDTQGNAIWQNRHYRVTGDRLDSQFTFDETMIEIGYEWSKRDVHNWCKVVGYKYIDPYYGLPAETWIYYAPTNAECAPFIPAGETVTLWGDLSGPRKSSDTLVKGTHWNANTAYDKSGTDVSDNITLTVTYYGQSIKFTIENTGDYDAYLVVPDSPPEGAPANGTLLVYGTIYEEKLMTVIEEDTDSQDSYGKRTLTIDAKFKSNYNDVLSYARYLKTRFSEPLPSPVRLIVDAWTDYPDDTIKIQCLTRAISDRITAISSKLGVNQDYYIDKIIQEYALYEGGTVHQTTFVVSRTEGQGEGQYWILGETGFSELGETTVLGF